MRFLARTPFAADEGEALRFCRTLRIRYVIIPGDPVRSFRPMAAWSGRDVRPYMLDERLPDGAVATVPFGAPRIQVPKHQLYEVLESR